MTTDADNSRGFHEVLTDAGPAGIAVVRIRGRGVAGFLQRHVRCGDHGELVEPAVGRVIHAGLVDAAGEVIDDILLSIHATSPGWDARLHLHGNPWLVRHCSELCEACGLRAKSGRRTTPWRTRDAIEADVYALLPSMMTMRGARWLLDQERKLRTLIDRIRLLDDADEIRAACESAANGLDRVTWFAQPLRVALVGPPNAGKSTLANALVDQAASIVSPTPGTTRDWVEIAGEADGFPVTWIDTAGLRTSDDPLEQAGVERTRHVVSEADAVVVVLDLAADTALLREFLGVFAELNPACVALNKTDLQQEAGGVLHQMPADWRRLCVPISASEARGLGAVVGTILTSLGRTGEALEQPGALTESHAEGFRRTRAESDPNIMKRKVLRIS